MDITVLDLSAYLGLIAVGAITINMLLGVMMAFNYSPVRYWPHRRFNYFRLHNWTGYIALFFVIVHPIVLLLNKKPKFRVIDLSYPVHSPQQPLENTIGAIALYIVALMVITSYFRIQLGRRTWKAFHFTVYLGAVALFYHSLFTDPDLKGAPIDWLDGGKLFVEACAAIILIVSLLRWRHSRRKVLSVQPVGRPGSQSDDRKIPQMQVPRKFWKVKDKRQLLLTLMQELAGDAHVSFEGDLRGLAILHMPGASEEQTGALKRNTLWPKQDFVVVPLEPSTSSQIISAIGGSVPKAIIHIQIEKHSQLQFGAYDNFHPETVYFGPLIKQEVVETLISEGIMRAYPQRRPPSELKSRT